MSYTSKTPPIKLVLDKELFNQLLNMLDFNSQVQITDENFSIIADKLKKKLLNYSVPKLSDDVEFVEVRFFPNEASDIIWQLLIRTEKKDNIDDYFQVLLSNREKKRK